MATNYEIVPADLELSAKPNTSQKRGAPRSIEDPQISMDEFFELLLEDYQSESGETVTAEKAMSIPAFFQAVNTIAADIAKIPLEVYKYDEKLGRKPDRDHPVSNLLRKKPNDEQTPFEFTEQIAVHLLIHRNAYIWIIRDSLGRPKELIPLLPHCTERVRVRGSKRKAYKTVAGGKPKIIDAYEICHIKGLSYDGEIGAELLPFARNVLGHALSVQKFKSRWFKGGAKSGGILTLPPQMSPKAGQKIERGIRSTYENADAWFKTMVLRDGATYHTTQKSFRETQMIEVSQEVVKDIARLFQMPPHKLGDNSLQSRSTLEQENKSYYDGTLSNWLIRIQQRLSVDLLGDDDDRFIEHIIAAIHWADLKTIHDIGKAGIDAGYYTPNEVRRWLNLEPLPDGDKRLIPLNKIVEGTEPVDPPADPPGGDPPNDPNGQRSKAIIKNYRDAAERVRKRIQVHLEKAERSGPEKFLESISEHRSVCKEILETPGFLLRSCGHESHEIDVDKLFSTLEIAAQNPEIAIKLLTKAMEIDDA